MKITARILFVAPYLLAALPVALLIWTFCCFMARAHKPSTR
jgi:hypothetical protein